MKLWRIGRAAAIISIVALVSGCGRRTPLLPLKVRDVPAARVDAGTRIEAMDALVDDRQVLHVVWMAREGGMGRKDEVWYQSSPDFGLTWNAPTLLCRTTASREVRLVRLVGAIHVIVGGTLQDYASTNNGSTWHDRGAVFDRGEFGRLAGCFDAVSVDSELCIAYTEWHKLPDSAGVWGRGYFELWLARAGERSIRRTLVPGYRGGLPALRVHGESVLLACARTIRRDEVRNQTGVGKVTVFWEEGQVSLFQSSDGGGHWSDPAELSPPHGASHWSRVRQVRWLEMSDGPHIIMNSGGALHLVAVRRNALGYPSWIPNATAYEMDTMNDRAFATTRAAASGMIASLAENEAEHESPMSDLLGVRPSDVHVAPMHTRGDSLFVGSSWRLTRGTDEVLGTELVETPRGALVFWRVVRRKPLLLGGGRIDGRIRFALLEPTALAARAPR